MHAFDFVVIGLGVLALVILAWGVWDARPQRPKPFDWERDGI